MAGHRVALFLFNVANRSLCSTADGLSAEYVSFFEFEIPTLPGHFNMAVDGYFLKLSFILDPKKNAGLSETIDFYG
jgi:hypothetical protein